MIPTFAWSNSFTAQVESGGGGPVESDNETTWDTSDRTINVVLTNGDLTANANNNTFELVRTTRKDFSDAAGGKWYFEVSVDVLADASDMFVGLKAASDSMTSGTTPLVNTYALWRGSGAYFVGGGWSAGSSPTSYSAGDVLMVAIDADNGAFYVGKNGTWNNSANPATGTNPSFTSMPSATDFAVLLATDNTVGEVQATIRVDPSDFTYAVPSGFVEGI